MRRIDFNIPHKIKKINYFSNLKTFAGNGRWTKKVQKLLSKKYSFKKVLLTDSCTSALEIAALSLKLKKKDEIIIPSYSYPTTASAFLRCGYKIRFVDCNKDNPRINQLHFLRLLNNKTKAIVVVHHAGQAEDIDFFLKLKKKYKFKIIEDAAQCIDLKYSKKYLGSYGDFGCISFHESKNIHCGLGGALIINNQKDFDKVHYIWERGTNRKDFDVKKITKYTWIEIGSNFYPSEFQALYLYYQLQNLSKIQRIRKKVFKMYVENLKKLILIKKIKGMDIKLNSNYHMKYILLKNRSERDKIKKYLQNRGIHSVSHYEPLHLSKVGRKIIRSKIKNAQSFSDRILRLPMHPYLNKKDIIFICKSIENYFRN